MENNNRLIKQMNGLKLRKIDCEYPIDKYHFIEYIDKDGNLNVAFALYYFRGVYFNLYHQKFFKPEQVTMCKKLSEYLQLNNECISINIAEYYKTQYAEDFITTTQWYKKLLEERNLNENNL